MAVTEHQIRNRIQNLFYQAEKVADDELDRNTARHIVMEIAKIEDDLVDLFIEGKVDGTVTIPLENTIIEILKLIEGKT